MNIVDGWDYKILEFDYKPVQRISLKSPDGVIYNLDMRKELLLLKDKQEIESIINHAIKEIKKGHEGCFVKTLDIKKEIK